jgi:predicted  nucleic acid-binding Zn-ribbon protein
MKSEKNPITQEAVERWQQGKINIFDEMAHLEDEINRLKGDLDLYKKVNLSLRKELTMCEKLIELNMKDLWEIADQRDWYYSEYQRLKSNNQSKKAKI